jgi:hypothetical protein
MQPSLQKWTSASIFTSLGCLASLRPGIDTDLFVIFFLPVASLPCGKRPITSCPDADIPRAHERTKPGSAVPLRGLLSFVFSPDQGILADYTVSRSEFDGISVGMKPVTVPTILHNSPMFLCSIIFPKHVTNPLFESCDPFPDSARPSRDLPHPSTIRRRRTAFYPIPFLTRLIQSSVGWTNFGMPIVAPLIRCPCCAAV